jgi:hypothetical protein
MKEIQVIHIWSPIGVRDIKYINLIDFSGYKFDDGIGYVTYTLIGLDLISYYENQIEIPASIIQQWGADDSIIWNYVIQQLGLVEVTQ